MYRAEYYVVMEKCKHEWPHNFHYFAAFGCLTVYDLCYSFIIAVEPGDRVLEESGIHMNDYINWVEF